MTWRPSLGFGPFLYALFFLCKSFYELGSCDHCHTQETRTFSCSWMLPRTTPSSLVLLTLTRRRPGCPEHSASLAQTTGATSGYLKQLGLSWKATRWLPGRRTAPRYPKHPDFLQMVAAEEAPVRPALSPPPRPPVGGSVLSFSLRHLFAGARTAGQLPVPPRDVF